MKNITKNPFKSGAPVIIEDFLGSYNELAGGLEDIKWRQLPSDSAGTTEIPFAEEFNFSGDFGSTNPIQETFVGPYSTCALSDPLTSNYIHIPVPDGRLDVDDVRSVAWNSLEIIPGVTAGYDIFLPPEPGVAVGWACIDSELRPSVADNAPSASRPYTNPDLWVQYAVRANGQIIQMSPKLPAGRHSFTIPFATFTGAEITRFDIVFRVYFGQMKFEGSTKFNKEPLLIWRSQIFARRTGV